jgi:hypothetical protein
MAVTRETTLLLLSIAGEKRQRLRLRKALHVELSTTKKRKLGTAAEGLGVFDRFAVDLMGTCATPGGRMSSPELRESSARMLEGTGGR